MMVSSTAHDRAHRDPGRGWQLQSDRYAVESQLKYRGLPPQLTSSRSSRTRRTARFRWTRSSAPFRARRPPRAGAVARRAIPHRPGVRPREIAARPCRGRSWASTRPCGRQPPAAAARQRRDFAVWCHYKYMNRGRAGSGCFVHDRHARTQRPGFAGWWGNNPDVRFRMVRSSTRRPARTVAAFESAISAWPRCGRPSTKFSGPRCPPCARNPKP